MVYSFWRLRKQKFQNQQNCTDLQDLIFMVHLHISHNKKNLASKRPKIPASQNPKNFINQVLKDLKDNQVYKIWEIVFAENCDIWIFFLIYLDISRKKKKTWEIWKSWAGKIRHSFLLLCNSRWNGCIYVLWLEPFVFGAQHLKATFFFITRTTKKEKRMKDKLRATSFKIFFKTSIRPTSLFKLDILGRLFFQTTLKIVRKKSTSASWLWFQFLVLLCQCFNSGLLLNLYKYVLNVAKVQANNFNSIWTNIQALMEKYFQELMNTIFNSTTKPQQNNNFIFNTARFTSIVGNLFVKQSQNLDCEFLQGTKTQAQAAWCFRK